MRLLIIAFTILLPALCWSQTLKKNEKLSAEIDSLANEDQKAVGIQNGKDAETMFKQKIRSNYPVIKKIFEQYGFPGYDLVGKQSSNNYWMLVQHTDFDVPFQQRALQSMKKQVEKRNASGSFYAYLIDRTLLNTGKKQIYGTQILMTDSGYIPRPTVDTLNLNRRRKKIGLEQIDDYLIKGNEGWNEMNKGKGHINIKLKTSILH